MNFEFRCGEHISLKKPLINTIRRAVSSRLSCIQLFISSPKTFTTQYPTVSGGDELEIRKILDYNNFHVYVHAPYVYNLNGGTHMDNIDDEILKTRSEKKKLELLLKKEKMPENLKRTIKGLQLETDFCACAFGSSGVVVHIGTGIIKDKAIKRIANTVDEILKDNEERILLLENSAAEGNDIGCTLEELQQIYDQINFKDQTFFLY